jgi:hypothetical protein
MTEGSAGLDERSRKGREPDAWCRGTADVLGLAYPATGERTPSPSARP